MRVRAGVIAAALALPIAAQAQTADVLREQCRALREHGPRKSAQDTCARAAATSRLPEDAYAAVMTLVGGNEAPTPSEVMTAGFFVEGAVKNAPASPWTHLANYEIAKRVGDSAMQADALKQLHLMGTGHPPSEKAMNAAGAQGRIAVFGWALLLMAVVVTLVRRARARLKMSSPRAVQAALVLIGIARVCPQAWAASSGLPESAFKIDDTNPSASTPSLDARNKKPLDFGYYLQELLLRAEEATKKKDHAAAARYYEAIVKAVPDRSVGYKRLCESYEAAGDLDKARAACRTALGHEGVVLDDYLRFSRLLTQKPGPLSHSESADLIEVIGHVEKQPGAAVFAQHIRCELGVKSSDVSLLEACTAALAAAAPNDPKTISFQWVLAVEKGDRTAAEALIERAQRAGMKTEGVERMRQETANIRSRLSRVSGDWRVLVALVAFVASAAVFYISRRRGPNRRAVASA